MTRDPRFPNPMHHASPAEEIEHDGERFRLEQRISFDTAVWNFDKQWKERREAVIHELWIEDWHGRPLPYAECLDDAGEAWRVWFHRDRAGFPMGVTGKTPEGAMF